MDLFQLEPTIPTRVVGQVAAIAPPLGAGKAQRYKLRIAITDVTNFTNPARVLYLALDEAASASSFRAGFSPLPCLVATAYLHIRRDCSARTHTRHLPCPRPPVQSKTKKALFLYSSLTFCLSKTQAPDVVTGGRQAWTARPGARPAARLRPSPAAKPPAPPRRQSVCAQQKEGERVRREGSEG
eukprot:3599226-Rhodomonas_salina.1